MGGGVYSDGRTKPDASITCGQPFATLPLSCSVLTPAVTFAGWRTRPSSSMMLAAHILRRVPGCGARRVVLHACARAQTRGNVPAARATRRRWDSTARSRIHRRCGLLLLSAASSSSLDGLRVCSRILQSSHGGSVRCNKHCGHEAHAVVPSSCVRSIVRRQHMFPISVLATHTRHSTTFKMGTAN